MRLKSSQVAARDRGSAGSGTEHWLGQRLSAVALVLLTIWFAISLLRLPSLDFYTVNAWIAAPLHAVLLILLVISLVYHSSLGTQVVVDDYIHTSGPRVAVLAMLRLIHAALGVAGIFAVFLIATRPPV